MATMQRQRHNTLAYIENTITGNLDKQQQSMATNPWHSLQQVGILPVLHNKYISNASTYTLLLQSKYQYLEVNSNKQAPKHWEENTYKLDQLQHLWY